MNRLIIIGASGHGKVCADIAGRMGYENIVFLDDNRELSVCAGCRVVGTKEDFHKYLDISTSFFVAIGSPQIRQKITEEIERARGRIATLIHPNAVVSRDVEIGDGTVIMAGVIVNPGVVIGKAGIINTASSVDHDCHLKDYVHVSVGAHLAGTVNVGERTWIGAGAVISNNINICSDCIIGAGAVAVRNIEKAGTYIGIPAKMK